MILIGFLMLIAVFAPVIANYDPILPMIGQPGETGRLPARAALHPSARLPGRATAAFHGT